MLTHLAFYARSPNVFSVLPVAKDVGDDKHWHGATPTTAMPHVALTGTAGGENVEWLEKVSDEQYRK